MYAQIRDQIGDHGYLGWLVKDYWGGGKSTLLYSLCYLVNSEFLKVGANSQNSNDCVAVYCNYPRKHGSLLDSTIDSGLPVPWATPVEKRLLVQARHIQFQRIIHQVSLRCERNADPGTNAQENPDHVSIVIQRIYQTLTQEFPAKRPNVTKDFFTLFTSLLTDPQSTQFLAGFRALTRTPGKDLANFDVFLSLCHLANVHVILGLDEAEDWRKISSYDLDTYLLNKTDARALSLILVVRTEIERSLRSATRRAVLHNILENLEPIELWKPKEEEILSLARGVLSMSRISQREDTYPFSRDFILAIAKWTKRAGRFNPRLFIRTISRILSHSLTWPRSNPEIGIEYIDHPAVRTLVPEIVYEDELDQLAAAKGFTDASYTYYRKRQMATELAKALLERKTSSMTRAIFENEKGLVARKHQLPYLSDLDMMAHIDDRSLRDKVALAILALDKTSEE